MSRVESIVVAATTERKTVPGRFEAALEGATQALASGVAGAVELAAPAVPFGNLLAGAVRASAVSGVGGGRLALAGLGTSSGTGSAGSQGDLLEATRAMQREAQAMNLQYLQLQERMQQESREFTTLSNVMRVKHDTARAAIGNIH
jgi:hypothetical protein